MNRLSSLWTNPRGGPTVRHGLAWVCAALLSACGGGGSSGPDTATGTGTPASTSTSTSGADCGLADLSARMRDAINAQRATRRSCGGAGAFAAAAAVSTHDALTQAATRHSRDMAIHGLFDHTGSDGSTMVSRLVDAGYAWKGMAENIGMGYADATAVVTGWMASDSHCANIMNASFKEMGAACAQSANGTRYWTLVLGTR